MELAILLSARSCCRLLWLTDCEAVNQWITDRFSLSLLYSAWMSTPAYFPFFRDLFTCSLYFFSQDWKVALFSVDRVDSTTNAHTTYAHKTNMQCVTVFLAVLKKSGIILVIVSLLTVATIRKKRTDGLQVCPYQEWLRVTDNQYGDLIKMNKGGDKLCLDHWWQRVPKEEELQELDKMATHSEDSSWMLGRPYHYHWWHL